MSEFSIDIERVKQLQLWLDDIYKTVNRLSDNEALRVNPVGEPAVAAALSAAACEIKSCAKSIKALSEGLAACVKLYSDAEAELTAGTSGGVKKIGGKAAAGWMDDFQPIGAAAQMRLPQTDGDTAAGGASDKPQVGWVKYLKKAGKTGLDALGKADTYGKMAALPIALLKNLIDGDGITGKDIGTTIKGMGNSIIGLGDEYWKFSNKWPLSTDDIKELAGLSAYKTITAASTEAGWLERLQAAGSSAWSTFKAEISPKVVDWKTGIKEEVKSGTKKAGWVLALIANGFSNYDEYNEKLGTEEEISRGRVLAETVTETAIDIGKGAAIAAGTAAAFAAIGVSAPAVVVGGVGVAVSAVADVVCERLTGKGVTELASDAILDAASAVGEAVTGAVDNVKSVVAGWFGKLMGGEQTVAQGAVP